MPTAAQAELLTAIAEGRPPLLTTARTWVACQDRGWVQTDVLPAPPRASARWRWAWARGGTLMLTPAGQEALRCDLFARAAAICKPEVTHE